MKKKSLTVDEMFCGMPHLRDYFKEMDRTIRKFGTVENPAVEELKEKKQVLIETAQNMRRTDLQLIYYVQNFDKVYPHTLLNALKKLFNAQNELNNLIKGTNEYKDITEK